MSVREPCVFLYSYFTILVYTHNAEPVEVKKNLLGAALHTHMSIHASSSVVCSTMYLQMCTIMASKL